MRAWQSKSPTTLGEGAELQVLRGFKWAQLREHVHSVAVGFRVVAEQSARRIGSFVADDVDIVAAAQLQVRIGKWFAAPFTLQRHQ